MKKRGFLGSAEVDVYQYWTEGKNSHELKRNETILYAEIDLCQSKSEYCCKTDEDLQEQYSRMDLMYVCLQSISICGSDDESLKCAGAWIGNRIKEGAFSKSFTSVDEENLYVDALISELKEFLKSNDYIDVLNRDFDEWFMSNVVEYNYYNTPNGKTKYRPVSGLGATTGNDDFSSKMKKSAMSLMYYGANTDNLYEGSDEELVSAKLFSQNRAVQWFAGAGTNMTTESIASNIKSGIIESTGGLSQEEAIYSFREEAVDYKNGTKGVGELFTLIVTLVSTAITIALSIIKMVQANKAKGYYTDSELAIEQSAPDPDSYAPSYDDYVEGAKAEMQDILNQSSSLTKEEMIAVGCVAGVGVIGAIAMLFTGKKDKQQNE